MLSLDVHESEPGLWVVSPGSNGAILATGRTRSDAIASFVENAIKAANVVDHETTRNVLTTMRRQAGLE